MIRKIEFEMMNPFILTDERKTGLTNSFGTINNPLPLFYNPKPNIETFDTLAYPV
jgi:hypothetical protein